MKEGNNLKPTNFAVAKYLAEKKGYDIPEDKLMKIAKIYNFKPKCFISNYKDICTLRKIFDSL